MPPNQSNSTVAGNSTPVPDTTANGGFNSSTLSSEGLNEVSYLPSVADFYHGRNIFITGGTGFMGKVLVEKLLRSCPSVGKIFLLMRSTDKKDVKTRLEDLLKSEVFNIVRQSSPEAFDKIIPLEGDVIKPALGLSDEDVDLLTEEVHVVFHVAATVTFNEPLRIALQINVAGTKSIIELCRKMTNLKSLVHVSTAFSNCDRKEIDEVIYDPPSDPNKMLKLLDLLNDAQLNALTPELIGNKPNTYTYTKALAESLLASEANDIPVVIVRPSIVGAAWKEPIPGWVDTVNGLSGIIIAGGKGVLRSCYCPYENKIDLIPVDVCINLFIVAARYAAFEKERNDIKVFHCSSGMDNPVLWKDMKDICLASVRGEAALTNAVWYPDLSLHYSERKQQIHGFVKHWLPAYLMDAVSRVLCKKPIMVKVARKVDRVVDGFRFFSSNEWYFNTPNVRNLLKLLSIEDKQLFDFDLSSLDWSSYLNDFCKGTKLFVLKEDSSTLEPSRSRINKLFYIRFFGKTAFALGAMALTAPVLTTVVSSVLPSINALEHRNVVSDSVRPT